MGVSQHKISYTITNMRNAILLTLVVISNAQLNQRTPRLFLVSTQATTSTLSTNTVCFTTGAAAATTCAKRRRAISIEGLGELASQGQIEPSEVEPSSSQREGRLANGLLYWITTTSTSTLSSFTSTVSIATLECTPAGSTLSVCGK